MSTANHTPKRIEIYDTTLRDGSQGQGVTFSLVEKIQIAQHLDTLGVDFIEGGFPLSNPKDEAFFRETATISFEHARICAFGMTHRKGLVPEDDPGMKALVAANADLITIVGKSWDLHVVEVLRVETQENLEMIRDSVAFCRKQSGRPIFYDAEHFFDGFRHHRDYALSTIKAALDGGAERMILCDTNGGSLPGWIASVLTKVRQELGPQVKLGIHTHNDCNLGVANTLAAVEAGAMQVQGTINGIGERCGNADLTSIIANLKLKMGCDCLNKGALSQLTHTSRFIYELANLNRVANQPFVGSGAFAHKGGMHVHAVQRVSRSYEHVEPESVGNSRSVLVSELSGASNITATLGQKFDIADDKVLQRKILQKVQDLEHRGYQFEAAEASFELLLHRLLGTRPEFWKLDHYRCVILKTDGDAPVTEAIVKLLLGAAKEHHVADGDGPVHALDGALRKCLVSHYPAIREVHLSDYKVRVVNPTAESAAKVRVIAEFAICHNGDHSQPKRHFTTIGVNENIVDASWQALADAFTYHLIEVGQKNAHVTTATSPKN